MEKTDNKCNEPSGYQTLSFNDKKNKIKQWLIERMVYAVNQVTVERNRYNALCQNLQFDNNDVFLCNPTCKDICPSEFAIDVLISFSYDINDFAGLFDISHAEKYVDKFIYMFGIIDTYKPIIYKRFTNILSGTNKTNDIM